jgi:molybdate transport system substrate-binding protein
MRVIFRFCQRQKEIVVKICQNCIVLVTLLVLSSPLIVSAESLKLYAAGSPKAALSDVVASYEKTSATKVTTIFGPSGLLRNAIEEGEKPDIFASADTH